MKVVFLMGGTRNASDASGPVYMAEIDGRLILERQIEYSESLAPSELIFCALCEDIERYRIDSIIRQCAANAVCIGIHGQTAGSVCTALLAANHFDNDEELVLMAIDDLLDEDALQIVSKFRQDNRDVGVVSFTSVHPRYSFALLDEDTQKVVEVAEKRPISKSAIASFYYFKRGSDFVRAAKSVIQKDNRVNGFFYISQAINELILEQKNVGLCRIESSQYHPLKSDMQLTQYLLDLRGRQEAKPK